MNKTLIEYTIVAFLVGIIFGMLLSISIKYKADLPNIQKYQPLCGTQAIKAAKIGITSDVYTITCANDIEITVR